MTSQTDQVITLRQHALEVFQAALKAVDPVEAVVRYVKVKDDTIHV